LKFRKLLVQEKVCVELVREREGYKEVLCSCHSVTLMHWNHVKLHKERANSRQTSAVACCTTPTANSVVIEYARAYTNTSLYPW